MKKFFEYFIKIIKILQEAERDSQKKKIRKRRKEKVIILILLVRFPSMGLGGGLDG